MLKSISELSMHLVYHNRFIDDVEPVLIGHSSNPLARCEFDKVARDLGLYVGGKAKSFSM
jgi:hypothetical protein